MAKWKCSICGYIHDEENAGLFANLAEGWVCPLCKAEKSAFTAEGEVKKEVKVDIVHSDRKLTALETSIVCSNLGRGCEKQYMPEEAKSFYKLAEYFKSKAEKTGESSMEKLRQQVENDLEILFPQANQVSENAGDRGALRALTWSVKVTTLLKSLLGKYGDADIEAMEAERVFVCTICGFIYVGSDLPQLCPVCKVPNYKFEEIKGGN